MAVISVKGVTKTYHSRASFPRLGSVVEVLRGVDLEAGRAQVVGLVGPNGAGKTTLLEILATLVRPDAGRAVVGGHDVVTEAADVRRLVAYCPAASHTFYPQLSGLQNLEFFVALHGFGGAEARGRIREALEIVGIDGAARAAVQTYSEGLRQRLALARTFATGAGVLLLDEPTKSLDTAARTAVHRFFRRTLIETLRRTLLVVTHNAAEAAAVCDRVVMLDRGRVTDVGSPDEVLAGVSWTSS